MEMIAEVSTKDFIKLGSPMRLMSSWAMIILILFYGR